MSEHSNQENKVQVNVVPNSQYLKKKEFYSYKNPYEISKSGIKEKPKTDVNLDLKVDLQDQDQGIYEVVIKLDVNSTVQEQELFKIGVDYGGLFTISNHQDIEDNIKEQILMIHCPTLLFPYLRREVSTETAEAGYQPLMLNNIDFQALYRRQKEQQTNNSINNNDINTSTN